MAVKAGKTPYVRFDLNDYSIPHTQVRRPLTVLADPNEVRIVDGRTSSPVIAAATTRARRSRMPPISRPWSQQKRAARRHRGTDHLAQAAPASQTLLLRAAERGDNLGTITAALLRLLERYGAAELASRHQRGARARRASSQCGPPRPRAAAASCATRLPPVAVNLPEHVKARDVAVQPHRLELYDQLKEQVR